MSEMVKTMKSNDTGNSRITESQMHDALTRSGYLLESRIVNLLVDNGFFVEPNQRILDAVTQKSREIDLIAEQSDRTDVRLHIEEKVVVSVRFVCEIKNNPHPVVLLTELPFSPNLEIWESLHEARTGFPRNNYIEPSFFELLTEDRKLFTQYCSFRPKKNASTTDWMAWHPDDFHNDLEKLITYCLSATEQSEQLGDDFHRLFLYIPVVILASDLYSAELLQTDTKLSKIDYGYHVHFDTRGEEQLISLVLFVTEKECLKKFKEIVSIGKDIEKNIYQSVISARSENS